MMTWPTPVRQMVLMSPPGQGGPLLGVLTFFPFSRYLWELLVYQTMIHQARNSVYIEPIFQVGDRNDKHMQKYTNKF